MSRLETLQQVVAPVAERRRHIESQPLPRNVAALIRAAAEEAGERMLWNFFESGERITYRELRRQVNGLAHALQGIGVRKGTHVAVMLPNIAAMPLTWLALAALGAVTVPVNVRYLERELSYVLGDSDASFLVIHGTLLPMLRRAHETGGAGLAPDRVIVVGEARWEGGRCWEDLAAKPREHFEPLEPVNLDDLMNIQYTSGTTGFPKGCMLTQRYWLTSGMVNALRDGRRYARLLASTPLYYMDPQWLLLMAMYQRGTLYVAAKQSTSRFIQWVCEHRINFCLLPYVVYKQPPRATDVDNDVIRANVYGVPRDLHARIEERFDLVAREAYGMTELGSAMFMPIEATDMVGSGSCGIPSPFRDCAVFDDDGRRLPPGQVGELWVRGPGITLGYYNKPEATAEVMRGEWFRTGDLFRVDERGYFYIVGRRKDMIRRSSENIAACEVEAVLNACPLVAESAVVPVPDPLRGEEVKAFVVLNGGAPTPLVLAQVVDACTRGLASFKVPRYYSFVDALPKTPSMKIAKQQLLNGDGLGRVPVYDRVSQAWLPDHASPHATEGP